MTTFQILFDHSCISKVLNQSIRMFANLSKNVVFFIPNKKLFKKSLCFRLIQIFSFFRSEKSWNVHACGEIYPGSSETKNGNE